MRLTVITVLVLLIARAAVAAQIALPLDGYYRPGRFFPVVITSDKPVTASIDMADGVGAKATGPSLTLPVMLLASDVTSIRVTVDGQSTELPVRALDAGQMLVLAGFDLDKNNDALGGLRYVKPGSNRIVCGKQVDLSAIDFAYESADAIAVLTPNTAAARAAAWRSGVPVVSSLDKGVPDRTTVARGPSSSANDQAAYDAISDWTPQRPAVVLRTTLLVAALFSIVVIAISLLGKRAWIGIVGVSVAAIAAGAVAITRPAVATVTRTVICLHDGQVEQADWTYRSALADAEDVFESQAVPQQGSVERNGQSAAITRPIFGGQASQTRVWVEPSESGWTYHATLPRGATIAYVTRSLDVAAPSTLPVTPAEPSPWVRLLQRLYAQPGEVVGQAQDEDNRLLWIVQPAIANVGDASSVTTSAKPAPH